MKFNKQYLIGGVVVVAVLGALAMKRMAGGAPEVYGNPQTAASAATTDALAPGMGGSTAMLPAMGDAPAAASAPFGTAPADPMNSRAPAQPEAPTAPAPRAEAGQAPSPAGAAPQDMPPPPDREQAGIDTQTRMAERYRLALLRAKIAEAEAKEAKALAEAEEARRALAPVFNPAPVPASVQQAQEELSAALVLIDRDQGRAGVRTQEGEFLMLAKGDELDGWKLARLMKDRVEFRRGKQRQVLPLARPAWADNENVVKEGMDSEASSSGQEDDKDLEEAVTQPGDEVPIPAPSS